MATMVNTQCIDAYSTFGPETKTQRLNALHGMVDDDLRKRTRFNV